MFLVVNWSLMSGTKGYLYIVDDEESLRENVEDFLGAEGYRVAGFGDGYDAWEALRGGDRPDLIILDVMMPRMDGWEFCRSLRERHPRLPVIFLSSRDEEVDRILGLELGGDDYVGKPFSLRELAARVKVQLRHSRKEGEPVSGPAAGGFEEEALWREPFWFHREGYRARVKTGEGGAAELPLTVAEFRILLALAEVPGRVKTRQQLLEAAYPDEFFVAGRGVDSHIKRLRRKLSEAREGLDPLETVYGLGYRFREVGE